MAKADSIASLCHHRWGIRILAELHIRQGERFAVLAHHFGMSRETLAQTLTHLIRMGLVRRNPGYGHPLRPEYLLTERGEKAAPTLAGLVHSVNGWDLADVIYDKWTLPLLLGVAQAGDGARFSSLRGAYEGLTPRALSDALKGMGDSGLLVRDVTNDFPPATRYRMTARGRRIARVVAEIDAALN